MINNFIANADSLKKLNSVLGYQNKQLIGFGDQIEKDNVNRLKKLEQGKCNFKYEPDDFTDMIDKSTKMNNSVEQLNLLFMDKLDRIALYHDDEWQEFRSEKGLQQMVRIHQTYFLEAYEIFILKRLYQDDHLDALTRNKYREQLKNYYWYLIAFDLKPFAYQKENIEIVDSGPYHGLDDKNYIEQHAMMVYNEAKKEFKKSEINRYRKKITELIRKNNQSNMKQLNDMVSSIINMDEQFKQQFLSNTTDENMTSGVNLGGDSPKKLTH
jgi:hypothetical protein